MKSNSIFYSVGLRVLIIMLIFSSFSKAEELDTTVDELVGTLQPSPKEQQQEATSKAIVAKMSEAELKFGKDPAITSSVSCAKMLSSIKLCKISAMAAKGGCLGATSPWIIKGVAIVGGLTSLMGQVKNTAQACQAIDSKMKDVQNVLAAYNLACSGGMAACSKTCGTLTSDISSCSSEMQKVGWDKEGQAAEAASRTADLASFGSIVAQQNNVCAVDYKWNLAAAGTSLITAISARKSASGCEQATSTTASNVVDCSDSKNASNATCICQKNPTAPGCGNQNLFAGAAVAGSGAAATRTGNSDKLNAGGSPAFGSDGTNPLAQGVSSNLSGGGGIGGGGGGSAGGGGGLAAGGGGVDGKEKTAPGKGLNPNILSGVEGGGGGGARGFSGASSSAYQAYMPGGAKDPSRSVASQNAAIAAQVSAAGSKSNWEKISDRYRDAKGSLVSGP